MVLETINVVPIVSERPPPGETTIGARTLVLAKVPPPGPMVIGPASIAPVAPSEVINNPERPPWRVGMPALSNTEFAR